MSIIAAKYEELDKYLRSRAYAWRADASRIDDIVQQTIMQLLEEEERKGPFHDARALWGRATNVCKEVIAQSFADRLPVSGVKHQAHRTAMNALQAAGGDPRSAYAIQAELSTSRVGRELIYAVASGPSLYSPEYLSEIDLAERDEASSITQQDEDNIRVAMYELTEKERQIVHLRMWMRLTNAQVAEELRMNAEHVRKTFVKAINKLRVVLKQSLSERYTKG